MHRFLCLTFTRCNLLHSTLHEFYLASSSFTPRHQLLCRGRADIIYKEMFSTVTRQWSIHNQLSLVSATISLVLIYCFSIVSFIIYSLFLVVVSSSWTLTSIQWYYWKFYQYTFHSYEYHRIESIDVLIEVVNIQYDF